MLANDFQASRARLTSTAIDFGEAQAILVPRFGFAFTFFADLEGTAHERGFDHRRDPAFAAAAVLDFGDQGRA
jgi:hypothetical protein